MAISSLLSLIFYFLLFPCFHALSSIAIASVPSSNNTITLVCALVQSSFAYQPFYQQLNCTSFPKKTQLSLSFSNTYFSGIVGGNGFLCALTSTSVTMLCWRFSSNNGTIISLSKMIYQGPAALKELDAGKSHICGLVDDGTNRLQCWQWRKFNSKRTNEIVSGIAVGGDFVCGLKSELGQVQCLGNDDMSGVVPGGNFSVVAAGFRHACGIARDGSLECWGEMVGEKPRGGLFKSLALGENRTCGIRSNGTVVCWGDNGFDLPERLRQDSFEAIEVNGDVFCGISTSNFSLYCWGNVVFDSQPFVFGDVVPGPCQRQCPCNRYPDYGRFCRPGLMICQPCSPELEPFGGDQASSEKSGSGWSTKKVAFLVVGCVGCLSGGIASFGLFFFRYVKTNRGSSRVHDSGPLDEIERGTTPPEQDTAAEQVVDEVAQTAQAPRVLEKRLSQMFSLKNGGNLEDFILPILLQATDNFSDEHKIGTGSFGSVYRATLQDGREVAIKRAELSSYCGGGGGAATKRKGDNENAFVNELECLSRLNHKNLVRLLGFCEDCSEYALVYEYMSNGSLHDHLHNNRQNTQSSDIMSWPARIRIALDAARGIKYLHVYAVPPIIHRDIKSSNILLDATWTAKVSDFGLSLMGPQEENAPHLSLHAAGTVGYIDPEYFRLQRLTTKSDVYSFGVLLLELLSGYKAIHLNEERMPRNVVDYVVPYIIEDDIHRVLDPKLPSPTSLEMEAIAYIGYLAVDCVTLAGQDRPTMSEIVNSLERALAASLAVPSPGLSRSTSNSSL